MAPINWKRPPLPTRTSKNRIGNRSGQNSDVSKKFPWILKCFHFCTKCFHFLHNVSKSFRNLETQYSAMDQMCLTSMQLTQYNLDLFQPIKAENMVLISSNWKTPQKAFFRAISGLRVFLMAPINWKRPPLPTRTSKNRIRNRLGQNLDVSKKFPWILKCFSFCTKCFHFLQNVSKSFRTLETRFSAMDQMCLTSMQLTQYNLDLFQPIKAENMVLISSNWKTPQKAFFRAISGL